MRMRILLCLFSLMLVNSLTGQILNGRMFTKFNNFYSWRGGMFDTVLNIPDVTATAGIRRGALRYSVADSSAYIYTGSQWLKIGSGGGVGGNDSAYINVSFLPDSSGFVLIRDNNGRDTIKFDGVEAGGSGGSISLTTNNNKGLSTLSGTTLNIPDYSAIDTGTIANRPVSPFIGQRYYQTDELVGFYKYTPRGWQWEYPETIYDIKFHGGTGSTNPRMTTFTANGGGIGFFTAFPLGMNESAMFNTGTNSNGVSGYRLNTAQSVSSFSMRNRYIVMQHRVVFSHTSNSTDRFVFYAGSRNLEHADGNSNSIFWRYTDTLNSGNWQLVIVDASGTTTINTSTAVDDSTIYNLVVQKEPTFIRAFINGTKVGEAVLTEPSPASAVLMNAAIVKRSGTAERRFLIDKIRMYEY